LNSQVANFDFLENEGKGTSLTRLWKLLGSLADNSVEKIDALIQAKILDATEDKELIGCLGALTSAQWTESAEQLKNVFPAENSLIIVEVGTKASECRKEQKVTLTNFGLSGYEVSTRRNNHSATISKDRSNHCQETIKVLRNRAHDGIVFSCSGLPCTSTQHHFVGKLSCVYIMRAIQGKESTPVAVKVLFEERNEIALNELKVLSKLQADAVPYVVRPFGTGGHLLHVSGRKVFALTLHAVNVDSTDTTLRTLVNIEDFRNMAVHILEAVQQFHSKNVVHRNLEDVSNILYNAIDQTILMCGWSQSQIIDLASQSSLCEGIKQDARHVGALLLSLLGRKKNGEEFKLSQVQGDLNTYISLSITAFNLPVADENRMIRMSSPLVAVIRGLIGGRMSIDAGLELLLKLQPIPEQGIKRISVYPRFIPSMDRITYPLEIREKHCFNEKGEKVVQHGVYVTKRTPDGVPLGGYAGTAVTAAYQARLIKGNQHFHLISSFKAGGEGSVRYTLDGRRHAIFDLHRAAKTGQVQVSQFVDLIA
jgi:hypothetical protein